ncbi:uncharacterized protein LOC130778286 isoform X1 [Actinidia eriantha]|uniref:uncharacterized protein LOC130778286 isoform X1 n=1 Tax=Actinidia eriantha TaxID=165200 RepID=UPI00258C5844|nr:uncharacterized protein LOC130778286 isoform X1 [Actinidia eriantha]
MELIRRYWRNIERTLENLRFRFGDKASKDSLAAAVEEGESTILECYIYVFEALLLSDYIHEGAFILSHPLPPPHRELVAKGQTRSYACKNIWDILKGSKVMKQDRSIAWGNASITVPILTAVLLDCEGIISHGKGSNSSYK